MFPALRNAPSSRQTSNDSAWSRIGSLTEDLLGQRSDEWNAERQHCRADKIYWVNAYCYTYDPRLLEDGRDPFVPFLLFPKQVEFIEWIDQRRALRQDGLAEKSRDCGFTFASGAYSLHEWLFEKGFSAGFGSRVEDLIDQKGDPDSIFEKIRVMLYRLPEWMLPRGFKKGEHDNHMRLVNPENGSTLTGEAGDNIGRGGRKSIYFVDEAAFLDNPKSVEKSLSQTTRTRIWISTPNGMGNPFYTKRNSGKVNVFTFHWKEDPRKNRFEVRDSEGGIVSEGHGYGPAAQVGQTVVYPWYEHEKERLDPVTLAQEVDIDYTASVEGICIPAKWVRSAVELQLLNPDGTPYVPHGPIDCGFDVADGGACQNVLTPRQGPQVYEPIAWGEIGSTESAWRAADEAEALGVATLKYDFTGPGTAVQGAYLIAERVLKFEPLAVNVGMPPSEMFWPDGRQSKDRFLNRRAELWWKLRVRFEKTYEYVVQGIQHPVEELISIPNCPGLISDLSLPLIERRENGKIQLESKAKMAKRGIKSPDYADSLALTEFEDDRQELLW